MDILKRNESNVNATLGHSLVMSQDQLQQLGIREPWAKPFFYCEILTADKTATKHTRSRTA